MPERSASNYGLEKPDASGLRYSRVRARKLPVCDPAIGVDWVIGLPFVCG